MKFSSLILIVCGCALFFTNFKMPSFYIQSEPSEPVKNSTGKIICWWSFNEESGHFVFDKIQQKKDSVFGSFEYVPGIYGNAIKLDGFRTYIKRDHFSSNSLDGEFTVESWIALASYPWSWSPVLDCSYERIKGFFFGIDSEGHVGFKVASGNSWYEVTTKMNIPLREWTHIAAVFKPGTKITIFINGQETASADINGNYVSVLDGPITIGRNNRSQTWYEYQFTTKNTFFFLDGLLDEIKISGTAKTEEEIRSEFKAVEKKPVPALSDRNHLPLGPVGSGSFGAFYTRLDYYKEWDDLWRVSDVPDVFLRFDQSPVQLIFWRGTSFVPCWVTENGIWYTNEWLETWGSDVVSCAEPIMDRQCRYSHVRIIENTDARVVIHWRYALCDALYNFVAVNDDGRGEWCDEFHIIYPDMIGVRKMELHYSRPERKHDWVEQIVVLPPGKYPDDVIERESISLLNMSGDIKKYSWDKDLEINMPEPKGACISFVNLKSGYKPFFIVSPDSVETIEGTWSSPYFRTYAAKMAKSGYRPDPVPSAYGWWNHWPVAQVPGDGRWVIIPDRPSHFNLTTFVQWKDYKYNSKTRTRIMLQGMTDKEPNHLMPLLAKAWLKAPKMEIISDGYKNGCYDPSERAYIIEKEVAGNSTSCKVIVKASEDSPLLNPAIIIKNWGTQLANLSIDGHNWLQGKDFRQGIRKGPFGEDLILWIRLDRQKPVEIRVGKANSRQ